MSLATWKKKYYPVDAAVVLEEDALDHSYRKWNGLKPKALLEHDLRVSDSELVERGDIDGVLERLEITCETCALCVHHLDESCPIKNQCRSCPICVHRGGTPCDKELPDEEISPYNAFVRNSDPVPMIRILKSLARKQKNGQ